MNIPDDRKYNRSHEWAQEKDGRITVGISDFAQDQLGDVVYVELPRVGDRVEAGQAIAVVESVKTASDIYAPVAGKIVEVNEQLESKPELLNASPYEEGWMFRIESTDADLSGLLDANDYRSAAEEDS